MRRKTALPRWLQHGLARAERERKANVIARPMRNLMDMLKQGEVYEIDGRAVMRMPEIDEQFATRAEWCEVAPAIRGWIDCWGRIAPDLRLYHMGVLADCLDTDKPITPRLVEKARAEFEATVARIPEIEDGRISSAIVTTQIAWEVEKLQRGEAA